MAVIGTEIKFYHSLAADGGDIDTGSEIVTATLNSFIQDTSAADSEAGVTKYTKFYVKNTNGTDTAYNVTLGVSSFSLGDDYFEIYESTGNATTESTETFTRAYGVAHTTGELSGFEIPIEFEDSAVYADIFQVGDKVTFFNSSNGARLGNATIAAVTSTLLTINEDLSALTLNDTYVGTVIEAATLAAGAYKGYWLKQVVPPFSTEQLLNTVNITCFFDPAA